VLLQQTAVSRNETPLIGWFGIEFGRALASCAEIGIQSGFLLHCDLDRLLSMLCEATLQLAGFKPSENGGMVGSPEPQALPEEAGFLLDQIAEIGMYAHQIDDKAYSDWFVQPAIVLASLENKLEELNPRTTGPPGRVSSSGREEQQHGRERWLASRSLAARCLVNYATQQLRDGACPQSDPPVHGWRQLGEQARSNNPQLWSKAKDLAMSTAVHPSRMPPGHDEADVQQRLTLFFDAVQTRVAALGAVHPRAAVGQRRRT
jgi:hypothetical protein